MLSHRCLCVLCRHLDNRSSNIPNHITDSRNATTYRFANVLDFGARVAIIVVQLKHVLDSLQLRLNEKIMRAIDSVALESKPWYFTLHGKLMS
jgi:hypothetical protein